MRAIIFEQTGEPRNVLRSADRPDFDLAAGTVRIRMIAAPVNPSDLMTVRGGYTQDLPLPACPGYEGVGRVVAARAGLFGHWLIGKRVTVLSAAGGTWADEVVVPARSVIPLSRHLSDDEGATFFVNPATATLLIERCREAARRQKTPRGQRPWIIQSAAASQVGRMIIRLAAPAGFRTINLVRRAADRSQLESLGADYVLVSPSAADLTHSSTASISGPRTPMIDQAIVDEVSAITAGQGAIAALDAVGGVIGSTLFECLTPAGEIHVYGSLSGTPLEISPRTLISTRRTVRGFWLGQVMPGLSLLQKLRLVRQLTREIQSGTLRSEIAGRFSLEQITDAVVAAETPGRNGKILLQVS